MKKVLRIIKFLKKYHFDTISVIAFVVILIGLFGLSSHVAQAQTPDIAKLFGLDLASLISESLANFFYSFQTIASWLITLSGALLNFSINLTMHIKDFVNATPAIYTVWAAIRDLSGMFIIFALLYAAIMLITGYQDPKLGGLIKNIVVAGVLINFSFFITGLAIDASNIVSLQLYSALAPTTTSSGDLKTDIGTSIKSPGLSNIFMQSLGITRLYNPNGGTLSKSGQQTSGDWSAPVKIMIIGITSIIIMITAALSFFLASLAFIARFVILLFLLAFSPIVFASFVVPKLGDHATKWIDMLKSQLFFMPVYLLLMYFALSVLTSSSIFKTGYAGSLVAGGGLASDLLAIGVNAALVIIMLNIPLVAAMTLGAKMPGFAKNLTADAIWKKVGGFAKGGTISGAQGAWKYTGGLAASRINNSESMRKFYAENPNRGRLTNAVLSKVASGYDKSQSANEKATKEFNKQIGKVNRGQYATEEEYKHAQDKAREYQAKHRQVVTKNTILAKLINSHGSRRAGFELEDKARKDKLTKDLKENTKTLKKKEEERDRLKSEIKEQEKDLGLRPGTPASDAQKLTLAKAEEEVLKWEKLVDDGQKQKEEDDTDRLASKVSEKSKDTSDKDKDKPKT